MVFTMDTELPTIPAIPRGCQSLTWLRVIREIRGLTQDDLAAAAQISKISISRLETGHRAPRWSTARKLAQALNVAPEQLFPDEGSPTVSDVLSQHLKL